MKSVVLPFANSEAELEFTRDALRREREAERERFQKDWLALPLERRREVGVTLYPIVLKDSRLIVGERWKTRFEFKPGERRHRFQSGQPVELFREGEDRVRGVLTWIGEREFEAVLDEIPDWLEEGKPGIDISFNESAYREMEGALDRILKVNTRAALFRRDLLLGYAAPAAPVAQTPAERDARLVFLQQFRLNPSQTRAALGMAAASDFAVVHGPPGTGKTTSLVAAIALLAHEGQRLLVTAPTNAAVDLLAERLAPLGAPILRIGHPGRVDEAALRHTVDGRLADHPEADVLARFRRDAEELHRKAGRYRRNFGPREREEREQLRREYRELLRSARILETRLIASIVESSRIILATLTGANHPLLAAQEFDAAVIDEAAQALEPAAWIPIQRAQKLILAGDHCQLPPTLLSPDRALAHTLFEKLIERSRDRAADRIFFLDQQYRMHPAIMDFSNAEFYEGRLCADASVLARPEYDYAPFGAAVVFVDTAGADFQEEKDPESESLRNPGEARLLVDLYAHYAPGLAKRGEKAGLIAPYRAQATLLARELRERNLLGPGVLADTVDSFQGGERDWIGISLTRCNEIGEIGFLGELRRINVALTRAKRMLVIVGDSATLSYAPFFARLMQYVEQRGEHRSAFEFLND